MTTAHAPTLASLAGRLHDDEIHVWHLAYRATQGRAPLRRVLAAYLGIDSDAVTLVTGEHGRPALAADLDPSLGFNWSHSGDHALIAIGRQVQPGIDLERRRERPRALEIARRYFNADESAALAALPAADRSVAFLELWTTKEAVLKALGRGIAFGLHRLSIASDGDRPILRQLDGDDVHAWQLQRLTLDPTLLAALAWRGGPRQIRLHTLASDG
ncbi:4'-phosphopantetheinyl transferase superfamily protein [Rhodanobacter sp. C03]|uniref:4'-phosphopantetheinyl transferase family protein n=1 Tax=Rhodanobacter sp. C03 TaxID=1945858 RepID=UPI000985C18F|nr:4'-phosphopantetheinyl transferase superfamily protein [Rhodanobacter sp. C03]OOG53259.1 4-phosphopantetheinyl transferase [Rhodanobacter sp. C03]